MPLSFIKNINFGRLILLALVASVLFFMVTHPLRGEEFGVQSDEGYYYRYAAYIQEHGTSGFRDLINWYADNIEAKNHPAPLRVGYILSIVLGFNILGPDYRVIACLSCLFLLALLGINHHFLKKFFHPDIALTVTALLTTSPLLLGLSRRALGDIPVAFFWMLALWTMLELYLSGVTHRRITLLIVTLIAGLLFKESTIALIGAMSLMAVILQVSKQKKAWFLAFIGAVCSALLIHSLILILMLGGISGLIKGWEGVLSLHLNLSSQNPYALYYSSGPWFRYLLDLFILTPAMFLLAIGYLFYFFLKDEKKNTVILFWIIASISIYFFFDLPAHSKVIRMVAVLYVPMAIFTAHALEMIGKRQKVISIYTLATFLGIMNFASFWQIFYSTGLLDPISKNLLAIQGFLPPL